MSLTKVTNAMISASPIHPQDFGAVGDGIADDTTAMQAAINAAIAQKTYVELNGAFKFGALTINNKCRIVGGDGRTSITAVAGSYDMFTISGSDVTIENLYIDDTAKTGGWDFTLACGGIDH
jgi:hypothetical protein